ncbi:hypothetical protein N8J89_38965 [Crossiella sp. CA-258035]|uniref:hypothetical protein n=1 Tax=Crossiella sp. CA-258035 TaxID=2981138 RepID=UPI0024BC459F|nr:hypothetical protein [Crossiella sp. CA-258035]WHT19013.1 hypothetical protein N8J89_38965 [Crossiella sp. CA-258035]
MAYETYDPWQPLRDRVCWAVVAITTCAAILVYFYPITKSFVTLGVCLVATVLAVISWRAPTKRGSAWSVVGAVGALVIAGMCFAYIPL